MHFLLTDRLSCPRCGPTFGLILRADHLVDRRVRSGVLGCPNCRDSFEISSGFADLRAPPRGPLPDGRAGSGARPEPEDVDRVVALLGIVRGPGVVAALGAAAPYAGPVAESVQDLMVIAVDPDARSWQGHDGVSRIAAAPGLPLFDRSLRGAVVDGGAGSAMLFEACRCTASKGRVVVLNAEAGSPSVIEEAGLSVLASQDGIMVAARG
jgi:hypothetical protein